MRFHRAWRGLAAAALLAVSITGCPKEQGAGGPSSGGTPSGMSGGSGGAAGGEIKIASRDIDAVREAILAPKFNYGAPRIAVSELRTDGTLVLVHDHASDGLGLDLGRAARVLEYVHRVWRRPVTLHTVDARGEPQELHKQ